jgi:hypothetical protein
MLSDALAMKSVQFASDYFQNILKHEIAGFMIIFSSNKNSANEVNDFSLILRYLYLF